jgi:hypothetical protein
MYSNTNWSLAHLTGSNRILMGLFLESNRHHLLNHPQPMTLIMKVLQTLDVVHALALALYWCLQL